MDGAQGASAGRSFAPLWTGAEFRRPARRTHAARDPWSVDPALVFADPPEPAKCPPDSLCVTLDDTVAQPDLGVALRQEKQRNQVEDFWLPAEALTPRGDSRPQERQARLLVDVALPWFDGTRIENPFTLRLRRDNEEELCEKRARWLVAMLDIPQPRRRLELVRFFRGVFAEFSHQSTFRALSAMALRSLDADILRNACAFRMLWMQRPEWWDLHHQSRFLNAPASLMTWSRAVRLVRLCDGEDPSDFIEDDWLWEWRCMDPAGAPQWSFADYLEQRLRLRAEGVWQPVPRGWMGLQ